MTDLIAELAEAVEMLRSQIQMVEAGEHGSARFWSERVDASASSFVRNNHAEITRIFTDDAAIRAAHHDLVIRLGEVTTRLEVANALLRKIRGCINETRGAYAGDVVREIDAHLSENGHE